MLAPLLFTLLTAEPTVPFEQLVKESSAAHQPIVIDAVTSWCKPCAMMEQVVFADASVKAALQGVRFARYDTERGDGVAVGQKFEISSWPTVLVLTADGTVVGKISGQTPTAFIAELLPLKQLAVTPGPFTDEALAKPDADPRALLIGGLSATNKTPPDLTKAQAFFERAAARDAVGKAGVRARAAALATRGRYVAAITALRVKTLLELAQNADSNSTSALGTLASYEGSYDRAVAHAAGRRLAAAFATDADALNELVYAQLAVHDVEGALISAKTLETLKPDANTLDTVAEAYFQAGQQAHAVELEAKAVAEAPGPELQKNLERFKTTTPKLPPYTTRNPLDQFEERAHQVVPESFLESQQFGAAMADACRAQARGASSAMVRLFFSSPAATKATRAIAFDIETPAPLRTCLEKAAMTRPVKTLSAHGKAVVNVVFSP